MDRGQFISGVEGSQKALRRFLMALCCGDSQLADDVAQEALIKAYLSLGSFNSTEEKFNAWLFRIAHNTFLNMKRAQHPTVGYEATANLAGNDAPDAAFRYQALYGALGRLPAKERASVLLYYMEGYDIKEISAITGNSEDAVRQHLSRGRKHLRELLDPTDK